MAKAEKTSLDATNFSEEYSAVNNEALLEHLSQEEVNEMHKMAYVYYQNQRYKEADALFRLLVMAKPEEFKFWKGLGACLQMKKNYQAALACYRQAQALLKDKPDPYLYVHAADCYFALAEVERGFKVLKAATTYAKKKGDQKILQHASFMKQRWKRK